MGDLANFQEFFISEGWGESRQNVSDLANFQEFFISEGWGERTAQCETWPISRNSSFLKGRGRAELTLRNLANFQEFFISQGWGDLPKVEARHVYYLNSGDISSLED